MTPDGTVVFLALFVCSLVVFRFYGASERYVCPYCGTRTGEHDESCIWSSKN
jgi:hypothetical protein